MKISSSEKLSLLILGEIHDQLNITNSEINTKLISDAIIYNQTWALDWEYSMLFDNNIDPTPKKVKQVVDILDMWDFIEKSYRQLDTHQQTALLDKLPPYIRKTPMFIGFGGNQEGEHHAIVKFLIHHMGRFEWLKDRELNSHMPMISRYHNMFVVFKPIRQELSMETSLNLSLTQLEEILKEY